MPIRILKKDKNKSDPKKRFDPRTGEETNKPGGVDPRTIYRPKPDVKPTEMNTGGDIEVKQLDPLGKRLSDVGMMGGVGKMNKYVLRNQKKVIQKIPNKNFKSATTSGKEQKKLAIQQQKNIENKMTRKGDEYKVFISRSKGGLSPKQKAIASKAPPPNKITGADFAVLKKEKAKGRGMGLQDEKIKPGKVMKAKTGKMTPIKKDPTTPVNPFEKRRKQLGGGRSKLPGRIGTVLGIGSMMVPAAYGVMKQYKDYKSAKNRDKAKVKKMGGGMMKKYSKGGGADTGRMGEMKSQISVAMDRASRRSRDKDRLTQRDIDLAKRSIQMAKDKRAMQGYLPSDPMPKKMGGGMMQRPMGYKKGTMVKARGCKLGRSKPTKMY